MRNIFPPGALVYLDGKYRVRVVCYWPEGSTSQLGPHYTVRETTDSGCRLTLTDHTGTATDDMPPTTQDIRVHPDRIGIPKRLGK